MAKNQAIKNIKSGGLRLFLMNKLKKYGERNVALAVQSAFRLPHTGVFDLRTVIIIDSLRKKVYEDMKEHVNAWLKRNSRTVYK